MKTFEFQYLNYEGGTPTGSVDVEDDHAMMPASLEVTLGIADSALNPKPEAESHE